MTQSDGPIQPAFAGIRAAVGEKIHQRLQKRLLQRRTVPVINADDAAQSTRLSMRPARAANLQKWSCDPLSIYNTPSRWAHAQNRSFSTCWIFISKRCLAGTHSTVSSFARQRSVPI